MPTKLRYALLLCSTLLPLAASCDDVIRESGAGGVNWTQGYIFATGYGTARPELSDAQRNILSRRAAIVDAQRNLLEIAKGVRITSRITTDQAMRKSRETTTRIEGIVKGAQVRKEHYRNEVFSVTMAMPIAGEFLKVLWPGEMTRAQWEIVPPRFDWIVNFLIPSANAAEPFVIRNKQEADSYRKLVDWMQRGNVENVDRVLIDAIRDFEGNNQYSGLLIDASGVRNFELATIPQIRDEEGNILYPTPDVTYDDIVNKRGVTYDFDLQDAIRNQRVATTPFTIRAVSTYKNLASDLVIRKADAARVLQSASTLDAMNKAGVLIVVAI